MTSANRVAVVLRVAAQVRHLYGAISCLDRQTAGRGEIVLVTDLATPAESHDWISTFASRHDLRLVRTDAATSAAARNAGVAAATAPYIVCLDAGDLISPDYHEQAQRILDANPQTAIVTSSVQWLGPGSARHTDAPPTIDLAALVGNSHAVHDSSMFRRDSWVALGGFDELLSALESFEMWLRILAAGAACEILDRPMIIRAVRDDAHYRKAWESEVEAFNRILEKHAGLFEAHVVEALYARELQLRGLGPHYLAAVARRNEAVGEVEALKANTMALREEHPEFGGVDLGDLNRASPVARDWGYERGTPIDRHYIESFLERHSPDIHGRVLEIQESDYTRRFGGNRVERSDVLDLDSSNARATIVGDLRSAGNIASDTYDCIILTQTVHVIDDMRAVFSECARILKPGGVLLTTLPSASRVCLEYGHDGDFWRVTEAGARQLLDGIFPADALAVESHGNVLVNTAFLYGLGCHELKPSDFEATDPYFPLIVSVRAIKPGVGNRRAARPPKSAAAILLYHRVAADITDAHGLCTAPGNFDAQMAHLAEHYHPMKLTDLVAALRSGAVPSGAVAVTFDDGYVDNDAAASPVLTRHHVPATFFVTTERLEDGGTEYWWDVLEGILLTPGMPLPAALELDLPGGRRAYATTSLEARMEAHAEIYAAIAGASIEARGIVMDALALWSGVTLPVRPARRKMTAKELVSLASREGHEVGAHSVRHPVLTSQPLDVVHHEIAASRLALENLLEKPVNAFAYPHGACDDRVATVARAASIAIAVTCDETPLGPQSDVLRLPRLEVTPTRSAAFGEWLARALAGGGA